MSFQEAQRLFEEGEKTGDYDKLSNALDAIEELLAGESETDKLLNLKKTIERYVWNQIKTIGSKYNMGDFMRKKDVSPEDEEFILKFTRLLFENASGSDKDKFYKLLELVTRLR